MLSRTMIFKISVIAILAILGFFVGMVFLGILLMDIFGANDTLILVGGILGSIIIVLIGYNICIRIQKEDPIPQYQHKKVKKEL